MTVRDIGNLTTVAQFEGEVNRRMQVDVVLLPNDKLMAV